MNSLKFETISMVVESLSIKELKKIQDIAKGEIIRKTNSINDILTDELLLLLKDLGDFKSENLYFNNFTLIYRNDKKEFKIPLDEYFFRNNNYISLSEWDLFQYIDGNNEIDNNIKIIMERKIVNKYFIDLDLIISNKNRMVILNNILSNFIKILYSENLNKDSILDHIKKMAKDLYVE